jgi:N-ethylmaleimide reductase
MFDERPPDALKGAGWSPRLEAQRSYMAAFKGKETTVPTKKLFCRVRVGPLTLSHRVVMAPLTRLRSKVPGDMPVELMAEYYGQRASEGGLIISEGTVVSRGGRGYLGAPGIYCDEHVAAWRKVTEAVHAKGGYIFMQLWHVGRVSHFDMVGGEMPVAPSVVPFEGTAYTTNGWVKTSPHRELKLEEIPGLVEEFRKAAKNAKAAGFDGVEIHAANGYIFDQFLQDGSNKRTDGYGGPVENRARLLFEALEEVVDEWGGGCVGVRLSPNSRYNSMSDSHPEATFAYVAERLNQYELAYLHIIEPRVKGNETVLEDMPPVAAEQLRKVFKGNILAAGGFDADSAEVIVEKGIADLVAFGRSFLANPDLPKRMKRGLPLNAYDRATFYNHDARGYTDYPFYNDEPDAR